MAIMTWTLSDDYDLKSRISTALEPALNVYNYSDIKHSFFHMKMRRDGKNERQK